MRKTVLIIAVMMLVMASAAELRAATLAGVSMPDTAQVAGKSLVLNGVGLRTKFVVKVYVAGIYLEQKSSDANAILKSDAPKRLVMQFVRDVSKKQMTDAFEESFKDNSPEAAKTMKTDIDRMLAALEDLKEGNQMVLRMSPERERR